MTDTGIACFLAVCRYKTGSRAAEALYITQSSLTTRLKNLERELGGQLFHRKKGGREMTLTDEGKAFYPLALQYEKLMEQMHGVFGGGGSSLRVSSFNSLGTYLLPSVYERFLQRFPGMHLEIQDMELESACRSLESGMTDIAFTTGIAKSPSLLQTPLFSEPMVLICAGDADYPDRVQLKQMPPSEEVYSDWSSRFVHWHQQTLGQHSRLSISIMAHLQQFMQHGKAWAIVPVSVAEGLKKDCGIRRLKGDMLLPRREVSCITACDSGNMEAIKAFCQCLRETLTDYPEIITI